MRFLRGAGYLLGGIAIYVAVLIAAGFAFYAMHRLGLI